MEEDYKKWLSQYRKGYIELCVLTTLENKDGLHGVGLLKSFEEVNLTINEGTLYPLLNRMEQNGWLESSWNMPKTSGHPKREYKISKKGEKILPELMESYQLHHDSLTKMMEIR